MLTIAPIGDVTTATVARGDRATIRAVLVGGDMLFREGLKRFQIEGEVMIVAEVDSVAVAIDDQMFQTDADLVVMLDHMGQGESLLTGLAGLRRRWPGVRTIMIAGEARLSLLARAIEAGADGYLCKDVRPEALLQSINLIMLGMNVFLARLVGQLLCQTQAGIAGRGETARTPSLTGREIDILQGRLSGLTNKTISTQLGISEATVKAQLRHLLRKLGVENRTQAALWAVEHHIPPGDEVARVALA